MKKQIFTLLLILLVSSPLIASELVYTPVNPNFGGNPLNGTFLLSRAQAQNEFAQEEANSVDRFEERLENAILSQLARRILDEAFGDGGLGEGGAFTTGDFTVVIITTNPDSIIVEITNNLTGEVTIIEVPIFGGG